MLKWQKEQCGQGTDRMIARAAIKCRNFTLKFPRVVLGEHELVFWKVLSHSHLIVKFLNS